jgi:heptaprenyl diphosphate synthase
MTRLNYIAGFLAMLVLLFFPSTVVRVLLFLFFWFLAWFFKKNPSTLFTVLVILCIVFFNLLMPYGQVLFSVSLFKVTSGALKTGIHRAVTLEGLVMLSRLIIRPDMKIPGFFGELLSDTFKYFAVIMSRKERIRGKNIIAAIDSLLIELSAGDNKV